MKLVIFIARFSTFSIFKYKSIIVNDTKHDFTITVKVTEMYTKHQAVTPTLKIRSLEYSEANYMHKLSSSVNKCPSFALKKQHY